MNTLFTSTLIILAAGLIPVEGCGSKNIECMTNKTFRFCFVVGNYTIYVNSIELSCSDSKICDANNGTYACIDATDDSTSTTTESTTITAETTTSSTTITSTTTSSDTTVSSTTAATVTAPDCSVTGTGKFAAEECNQYYECTQFLWWYYLNLYTCDSGTAFDVDSQACVTSTTCVTA